MIEYPIDSKIISVQRTIDYIKEWAPEKTKLIQIWERKLDILKECKKMFEFE